MDREDENFFEIKKTTTLQSPSSIKTKEENTNIQTVQIEKKFSKLL